MGAQRGPRSRSGSWEWWPFLSVRPCWPWGHGLLNASGPGDMGQLWGTLRFVLSYTAGSVSFMLTFQVHVGKDFKRARQKKTSICLNLGPVGRPIHSTVGGHSVDGADLKAQYFCLPTFAQFLCSVCSPEGNLQMRECCPMGSG